MSVQCNFALSISVCCPGTQCVGRETNTLFAVAMTHKLTEAGKWTSETSPSSVYGFFNPSLFKLRSCWLSTGLTHTLNLSLKDVSSVCWRSTWIEQTIQWIQSIQHLTNMSLDPSLLLFHCTLFLKPNAPILWQCCGSESPFDPQWLFFVFIRALPVVTFIFIANYITMTRPIWELTGQWELTLRLNSVNTQVNEWRGDLKIRRCYNLIFLCQRAWERAGVCLW